MRYVVAILLLLGAHFSLTAFVPGAAGKALFYWPWAADSKPVLAFLGGSIKGVLTPLFAAVAGVAFLCAFLSLFGWLVPAAWWTPLVLAGSLSSALLFLMYLGPVAILPLLVDIALLVGVLVLRWTVASLRG
jgi:hypothetical protein